MILNNIGDDRGVMKSYKLRDLSVVAFEHRWEENMSMGWSLWMGFWLQYF